MGQRSTTGPCPRCTVTGRGKKSILERTTTAFSTFFNESSYAEWYASQNGLLQFVDPRFKLVGMLWLIVCIILLNRVEWVLAILGVNILLAVASHVRLDYYLKRVWLFIPLFTLVIAIPAMFNFIVPGQPVLTILTKGQHIGPLASPWTVALTVPGVQSAILFVLRTGTAVSFIVLFALTTRWTDLLASFQSLKIPTAFVMILGMTYRYVFVLVSVAQDMSLAFKSRTLRPERSEDIRKWLSATIGVLFRRSMNMSELVNLSMISRGYDGRVRKDSRFQAKPFDWAFLGFLLGLGVILLMLRNIVAINGI
ncbi:MAG TPA: cobalt ECF transporter T component CbiQ [Candidatus Acidoferrales bacterium]|nr:cobalt ECF transporter T component CbiQ [Candidatus Acidoferrales bacterium]